MKNIKKRVDTILQWWATTLEGPLEPTCTTFQMWRRRFLYRRLNLGLTLGLLYFSGLTILCVIQNVLNGKFLDVGVLKNLVTALNLLGWLVWLQTPLGRRHQALAFLGLSWSVTMLTNIPSALAGVVNPDLKGWTMTFFAQATVIPFHWKLHLISQIGAYTFFFGAHQIVKHQLLPPTLPAVDLLFDMVWISVMPNLVVYLHERLARTEFWTRQKLREEQQRSERLLLNVLPQSVAERLMQEHQTIADSFAEVTVLFADIVGFTELSTQMSPTELVELLNQIFSRFDQLAEHYGLEKIKTIGDAYMVVAGLPQQRVDHAIAIADMAMAMQQAILIFNEETGHKLKMRMGIHTGPVIAGVIGLRKFCYDLWGDTVNTASRMESHGLPDEIQVTRVTYECLKLQYLFEERGCIFIKGKGEMTTYLLKAKRNPEN